ncbi:tripartite tricarboxylate transporter TctB family protein [Haloferax sp. AB510]|uniref:tripartite tricarboxylate transporter TctB family protein n=1 Tax=Haloferax sp. AB510 TaxID=2934172 RepID=UPI00209C097A|nr:tripartite tricarboxylate transporter TctB family protein [Haloferax sp. AB510]MCO8268421.1 tripartite tricarboxylate transporter TctB family protein [Haloferax sp. AB510]
MSNIETTVKEKLDSNLILLFGFLSIASWAFIKSFDYPHRDAIFPRLSSLIIILTSMILITTILLPESVIQMLIPGTPTETGDGSLLGTEQYEQDDSGQEANAQSRYALVVLIVLYLVVGYLVGLLWATPLFVFAYTLWTRQRPVVIGFLVLLSFAIAYSFMNILNLSIDEGILLQVMVYGT